MFRKRLALLLCLVFPSGALLAQITTGTISGIVSDETGAILPGVAITIKNLNTGLTRTVVTDDQGRYNAPNLPLGDYEVQAALAGFQTGVRSGIRLTVGREAAVNITLKVGEITEKLVVMGEAPMVQTVQSSIVGLVETKQIEDLPLNGRDYLQLVSLNPGAYAIYSETGKGSQPRGLGMRFSIGGARFNQNIFLLDGTDVNDYSGNTPGSTAGVMLGVDTIREFTVLTNQYSAEYGRQMGGVVSVVTRSGTNDLHGTLFYFHRNKVFDARNFFEPGDNPPPFKRNQFGWSLGGPIIKDKTFFMGTYEGFRQSLSLSVLERVPSLSARQGVIGNRVINIAPQVRPFLELYPLPNGRDFGDGRAEFVRQAKQTIREDYWMARIDHNFSPNDSLFARYTFDDAVMLDDGIASHVGNAPFGAALGNQSTRFNWLTLEYRKIISPTLLNTFRFAYNRTVSALDGTTRLKLTPEMRFIPLGGSPHGSIEVAGLTTLSLRPHASFAPRLFWYNHWEYHDSAAYTHGRHSINFGANVKRIQDNFFQVFRNGGDFIFTGLQQFLEGRASQFGFLLPNSDPVKGLRQSIFAFYVQDDFKATPRLTLNLGLRYEFVTVWKEVDGKLSVLTNPLTDVQHTVTGKLFGRNPSLKNFAPRFGLAWDPTGSGRMAVRGGFGIFYDQLSTPYLSLVHLNAPFLALGDVFNPPFPNVISAILGGQVRPSAQADILPWLPNQPYRMQWSLSIQRELIGGTVASAAYVGSRSVHLSRADSNFNARIPEILPDGRLFFPPGSPRRNPNFGVIRLRPMDGSAFYHALQLGLQKRFEKGVQFQISYTNSKNIDDSSALFNENETQNSEAVMNTYNRKQDRARSDFHVGHHFTANFMFELPFGHGKRWGSNLTGFAGKFLSGWQLGGIVTMASGQPMTALVGFDRARAGSARTGGGQRPDLVLGVKQRLGRPDSWLNPDAFALPAEGFFGNLGRNTVDGPGLATMDFSLAKKTALSETMKLEFRAEFFNLFNRANFRQPDRTGRFVFTSSGRVASPGRLTETATTNRQIQFGLKLSF